MPRRGKNRFWLEPFRHGVPQTQTPDAGGSEQGRVELAVAYLADPGVDVPPDRADVEVGPQRTQLSCAAEAARPDDRTLRKVREHEPVAGHQAVPHVLAQANGAQDDIGFVLCRKILERVDGEIDLAVSECPLELEGEEALAADLR